MKCGIFHVYNLGLSRMYWLNKMGQYLKISINWPTFVDVYLVSINPNLDIWLIINVRKEILIIFTLSGVVLLPCINATTVSNLLL